VENPPNRFNIAKAIVRGKLARSLQLLEWLSQRYDCEKELRIARLEASKLRRAKTVSEIRTCEGRTALAHWQGFAKAMPQHLEFQTRMSSTRQQRSKNASDPVNATLNFGYSILESEVRKTINAVGLEPAIGFLHDFASYQTKESLVYDLMEPFRFLIDLVVFEAFESRTLNWRSFFFTSDSYDYRFEAEAKKRFLSLLKERFNRGVRYKGRMMRWDTLVLEKTKELARYLTGKSNTLNFTEPCPTLERMDDREFRSKILALDASQAKQLGIGRSELHYLRRNARSEKPFKLYRETRQRLQKLERVSV
jgi:CRISPR-associated protein Cas1